MEAVYTTTPKRAGRWPARLRRKRPTASLVAVVVAVGVGALTLAGCGSGSPNSGVAHIGSTSTAASSPSTGSGSATPTVDSAQLERYAQCMRSHGVTNFYPTTHGVVRNGQGGIAPNSPQFKAAQQACRSLAPKMTANPAQLAALQAQALRFSQCMRSHGVPNYPDPQFHGNTASLTISKGIDPNSPQFKSAQQACRSLAPGGKGGPQS